MKDRKACANNSLTPPPNVVHQACSYCLEDQRLTYRSKCCVWLPRDFRPAADFRLAVTTTNGLNCSLVSKLTLQMLDYLYCTMCIKQVKKMKPGVVLGLSAVGGFFSMVSLYC